MRNMDTSRRSWDTLLGCQGCKRPKNHSMGSFLHLKAQKIILIYHILKLSHFQLMRQGSKAEFSIHDWFLHRSQFCKKYLAKKLSHPDVRSAGAEFRDKIYLVTVWPPLVCHQDKKLVRGRLIEMAFDRIYDWSKLQLFHFRNDYW